MSMTIRVKNGLIFVKEGKEFTVLDVTDADRIASANGHAYAETFAKEFDGRTLKLSATLLIKDARITK